MQNKPKVPRLVLTRFARQAGARDDRKAVYWWGSVIAAAVTRVLGMQNKPKVPRLVLTRFARQAGARDDRKEFIGGGKRNTASGRYAGARGCRINPRSLDSS